MKSANKSNLFFAGSLMAGIVLAAPLASAEDVIFFKDVPSAAEVNEVLFGKAPSPDGPLTRSIRVVDPSGDSALDKTRAIRMHNPETPAAAVTPVAVDAQDAAVAGPAPAAAQESSGVGLGFNLQFAFDSVDLLPESRPFIDRLGEVLGSPDNAGKQLVIVGHTDASGSDSYNAQLSERRAIAVQQYLTTSWNIDPSRLQIQGAGEGQPLDGTDPFDGINRRVEFYAVN